MSTVLRPVVALVSGVILLASLSSCSQGNSSHRHVSLDGKAASAALFDHLHNRNQAADLVSVEQTFRELVPSQRFSIAGAPATPLSAGLVVGTVSDVSEGRAYTNLNDAPKSTELDFYAREALWRVIEVTVSVEQAWGSASSSDSVSFGVVVDRAIDPGTAINGLRDLGRVIVSLDDAGRYEYMPRLYSVSQSGALLGTVDGVGAISFPGKDAGEAFMDGLDTLNEVAVAAKSSPAVINVQIKDAVPVRTT